MDGSLILPAVVLVGLAALIWATLRGNKAESGEEANEPLAAIATTNGRVPLTFLAALLGEGDSQEANVNIRANVQFRLPTGVIADNDTVVDTGSPFLVATLDKQVCGNADGDTAHVAYGAGMTLTGPLARGAVTFVGGTFELGDVPILCPEQVTWPASVPPSRRQRYYGTPIMGLGDWPVDESFTPGGPARTGFGTMVKGAPRTVHFGSFPLSFAVQGLHPSSGWLDVGSMTPVGQPANETINATDMIGWNTTEDITIEIEGGHKVTSPALLDTGTSSPLNFLTATGQNPLTKSGWVTLTLPSGTVLKAEVQVATELPEGERNLHPVVGLPVLQAVFEAMQYHDGKIYVWWRSEAKQ